MLNCNFIFLTLFVYFIHNEQYRVGVWSELISLYENGSSFYQLNLNVSYIIGK